MPITRRDILASLSAVAAAAVFQNLPAEAATFSRVGEPFRRGADFDPDVERAMIFGSRWQFQGRGFYDRTVRHCPTGLLFASDPLNRVKDMWLVRASGEAAPEVSAATLFYAGHSARRVAVFAGLINFHRNMAGQTGAFYVQFYGGSFVDPIIEEAPDLPHVSMQA